MKYISPKKRELIRRMSQAQQPVRTIDDLNKEYTQLCTHTGALQYKILCYQGDLQKANQRMFELQTESTKFSKDELNGGAQGDQDHTQTTGSTEPDTGETSVSTSVS